MKPEFAKSSMKRSMNITTSPMIAARMELSVSADMSIPSAMYMSPQQKMPIYAHMSWLIITSPLMAVMIGKIRVPAIIKRYTVTFARNFAMTILATLTGEVMSRTSVPFLRSSANVLMVRIGSRNMK